MSIGPPKNCSWCGKATEVFKRGHRCAECWADMRRRYAVTPEEKARKKAYKATPAVREKARAYQREYLARPETRARARERLYGISAHEQNALLAAQGGGCGICKTPLSLDRETHLDHDHDTGAVRGFLCGACNRAIGLMKDSPARLRAAAAYLERRQPKLRLVK